MVHVRNTQDSEATVIKANRKHQIVLNMEVKRIETEKKMRERYFSFEMSLMQARWIKIVDRQKSLGIYRPHTMENAKDLKKGMQATSFFFTQAVAMDSKVKLPPLFQRNRTHPGFPTKLAGNSKMLHLSKNFNKNKMITDKDQAKRLRLSRKLGTVERSNGQSQVQPELSKSDSKKRDESKDICLEETSADKLTHKVELNDSDRSLNEDQIKKQLVGHNLLDKGEIQGETKEGGSGKENTQRGELDNWNSNFNGESKDDHLSKSSTIVANPQNGSKKLSLSDQRKSTTTGVQNFSNITEFQELQAWQNSLQTCCFEPHDYEVLLRSKSATGYRRDPEFCNVMVRPQTAFARLTIK